jgi:hypothetical protein
MSQKTIIQRAQGYGNQPVTVTVKIDGNVIHQGTIPTANTPPPALPDFWTPELGVDAWSWTVPENFDGSVNMTVLVNNGVVYLCDTFYVLESDPETVYPLIYNHLDGEINTADPFTEIKINDVLQPVPRDLEHAGQWVWQLHTGDNFSSQVNITRPSPDNEEE